MFRYRVGFVFVVKDFGDVEVVNFDDYAVFVKKDVLGFEVSV